MANEKSTAKNYEYATVDTAPGAEGFATNPVSPGHLVGAHQLINFSVRDLTEGGAMDTTVTLQFQCDGDDAWTDYSTYAAPGRWVIDGRGLKVQWRAVVKQGAHNSGTVRFGFDF